MFITLGAVYIKGTDVHAMGLKHAETLSIIATNNNLD